MASADIYDIDFPQLRHILLTQIDETDTFINTDLRPYITLITVLAVVRPITESTETDIIGIRLKMTQGSDHEFEEWLTDPERLKRYIDVFNESSSSVKPLQAEFILKNGRKIIVDVSKDAQNNLQLNELLRYLNSNE